MPTPREPRDEADILDFFSPLLGIPYRLVRWFLRTSSSMRDTKRFEELEFRRLPIVRRLGSSRQPSEKEALDLKVELQKIDEEQQRVIDRQVVIITDRVQRAGYTLTTDAFYRAKEEGRLQDVILTIIRTRLDSPGTETRK